MKVLLCALLAASLVLGFTGCRGALFEAGSTDVPGVAIVGEPFTVELGITNTGSTEGIYSATLTVDEIEIETKEVSIPAGATRTLSFTLELEDAGTHTIKVDGFSADVNALDPAQMVAQAYQASRNAKTSKGDMTMTMSLRAEQAGQKVESWIVIGSEFVLDHENKEMEMLMDLRVETPGEAETEGSIDIYLVDDTVYTKTDGLDKPPGWQREEVTPDYWDEVQLVGQQIDIAHDAEINYLGMEEVDGVNCFIFEIVPEVEAFLEAILGQKQLREAIGEDIDEFIALVSGLFAGSMDISMQQWVTEDGMLLKKAKMGMELDLPLFGVYMEIGLDINVDEYNEPVSIVVPTEALAP